MRANLRSTPPLWVWVGLALGASPLHAQAPAPSSHPAADSVPKRQSLAAKSLQDWDDRLSQLQRAIWTAYTELSPLGKDARGRSVGDDLAEWAMTREARAQLDQARLAAEQALRAGNEARSHTLLENASGLLDEQERLLARIGLYWGSQPGLRRQRQLLEHWGGRAPELLHDSEARLQVLESRLVQSYSPQITMEELDSELKGLRSAYNRERLKIADAVSAQQDAAGQVAASRDRSLPCPPGPADPGAVQGDHAAVPLGHVDLEAFYPRGASYDGISGPVVVSLRISAQGCMLHGDVVRSSGSAALDDAALEVAEHMSFRPAVQHGQGVDSTMRMRLTFQFEGQQDAQAQAPSPSSATTNPLLAAQARDALSAAGALSAKEDYHGAIARLDTALAQEPNDITLLLARATAHGRALEEAAGRADIDRALQLQPRNAAALRLKGYFALTARNYSEALAAFNSVLEIAPKERYSLNQRVEALLGAGDFAQALSYSGEIVAAFPDDPPARSNYARLARVQHRLDESIAQAVALTQLEPPQRNALFTAASIYLASGKQPEALQTMNRAVTLFPTEVSYLSRVTTRTRLDVVAQLADLDAALKLAPSSLNGARMLAEVQLRAGNPAAAVAAFQPAAATHGEDLRFLIGRAIALMKAGKRDAAEADLNAARAQAQTAQTLNTLCWELAIQDVELPRDREACEAAVQRDPRIASFQDSLGLVLLKLGDLQGALKAYDAALQSAPLLLASRYGRGLVRQRLGDRKGAAEDLDLARRLSAQIDQVFADYGLRPQP